MQRIANITFCKICVTLLAAI